MASADGSADVWLARFDGTPDASGSAPRDGLLAVVAGHGETLLDYRGHAPIDRYHRSGDG